MRNLFDVKSKIVLITGSSRGIGFSLAKGFAEAGSVVIVHGSSEKSIKKPVGELTAAGHKVYGISFDVTKHAEIEQYIMDIETNIGPVEILINNAGIHKSHGNRVGEVQYTYQCHWTRIFSDRVDKASC